VTIRSEILERLKNVPNQGTEDAALSLLALRQSGADAAPLLSLQQRSGAWGATANVEVPNAFHTGLALLALRRFESSSVRSAADHALDWLSDLRGRESHWLWQWKFRLFDRQVRFDPAKSGWPWVPETVSWVAPTAIAVLALRAWNRESSRTAAGAGMLLDRACPQGGWNAGNSVVFGVELDPHPDFTAMALLALRGSGQRANTIVVRSVDYLVTRLNVSSSPYSLAWALMALNAYGNRAADHLRRRLEAYCTSCTLESLPARVLALLALALEQPAFTFEGTTR
jgi:hypothetical protein